MQVASIRDSLIEPNLMGADFDTTDSINLINLVLELPTSSFGLEISETYPPKCISN